MYFRESVTRMPQPRRDDFPNNFVGDLVRTDRGWVVVPPTCCPDGHESEIEAPYPCGKTNTAASPTGIDPVCDPARSANGSSSYSLRMSAVLQYSTRWKSSTGLLQRPAGITKKIRTGG